MSNGSPTITINKSAIPAGIMSFSTIDLESKTPGTIITNIYAASL